MVDPHGSLNSAGGTGKLLGYIAVIVRTDQDTARPPGESAVRGQYPYVSWPRPLQISTQNKGHVFRYVSQIRYTTLADFFFTDSSYSGYSRGPRCELATNEHLVSVPPVRLLQTGNFDFAIRLVALFWHSFAI